LRMEPTASCMSDKHLSGKPQPSHSHVLLREGVQEHSAAVRTRGLE
jgi:hypothetical protein